MLTLDVSLNTLFIAVIVLAALILIMIITFIVSVKPALNSNQSGNAVYNNSADNVTNQIASSEQELVSDSELVAVVTAAIYASMGDTVPEGGLVVRSIRRANTNQWKKS